MSKTNKLYPTDIFIYNRIKYFCEQKNGFCYESNQSLSTAIGRTIPRISASLNKLIRLGYIKNDGSKWSRQLKITEKIMSLTLNKNDMTLNKNDMTNISELLITLYKNDKTLLTKVIRDFNKNDNIVLDSIKLELIDISNKEIKKKDADANSVLVDRFVKRWNERLCNVAPGIKLFSNDRATKLRSRLKEASEVFPDMDCLDAFFKILSDAYSNSRFLRGETKERFKFSVDFVLQKSRFVKMIEGAYNDKQ